MKDNIVHKRWIPAIRDTFTPVENGKTFVSQTGRVLKSIKGHIHKRGGLMTCVALTKKFVMAVDALELELARKQHRKIEPNYQFRNSLIEYIHV